jgi:hypothetical protein
MKKALFIFFIFLIGCFGRGFSQSFNVGFLFNPGATIGGEFLMPSAVNDSVDFEMTKYKIQFSQPLKTKLGIKGLTLKNFSFKKLDAKASQIFLNYGFSVLQPKTNIENPFDNLYRGNVGITAITASVRKGIWIYSANLYAVENDLEDFTPNFRGYIANIKTKNLKTFYFYGGGLLFNQGQIIPFPLLGLKTRLGSSNFRTEIIIPLHVKLNYRFNNKVNMDAVAHFNGINTIYRQGSPFNGGDQSLNFRQLKTYLALNTKLGEHYKLKIEGGYSMLQQTYHWDSKTSTDIDPAPYFGIAINYNWGKSVFGSFMNRTE